MEEPALSQQELKDITTYLGFKFVQKQLAVYRSIELDNRLQDEDFHNVVRSFPFLRSHVADKEQVKRSVQYSDTSYVKKMKRVIGGYKQLGAKRMLKRNDVDASSLKKHDAQLVIDEKLAGLQDAALVFDMYAFEQINQAHKAYDRFGKNFYDAVKEQGIRDEIVRSILPSKEDALAFGELERKAFSYNLFLLRGVQRSNPHRFVSREGEQAYVDVLQQYCAKECSRLYDGRY